MAVVCVLAPLLVNTEVQSSVIKRFLRILTLSFFHPRTSFLNGNKSLFVVLPMMRDNTRR